MTQLKSNIVLIGMPGAGKSTVGVILAKQTSRNFIDTDVLIQVNQGRSLQQILDAEGYETLRKVEEEVLMGVSANNHVIATGGSAVYSERAMTHLKSMGLVVFLDVDISTIQSRVHDFSTRGIAKRADQDLLDVFQERFTLYTKYADVSIKSDHLTHEETCLRIIEMTNEI